MSRALAPLPRTRATTAWALMKAVNRAILKEPRRLDMGGWISAFRDKAAARAAIDTNQAPACGTVCCYAGWVKVIATGTNAGDRSETFALRTLSGSLFDSESNYNERLSRELADAFMMTSPSVRGSAGVRIYLKSGTRLYARTVVARFRQIMRDHAAYLKARKVEL